MGIWFCGGGFVMGDSFLEGEEFLEGDGGKLIFVGVECCCGCGFGIYNGVGIELFGL